MASALATRINAFPDLALARAAVGRRRADIGPACFASELEPLLVGAGDGIAADRGAGLAIASWIAHALANGQGDAVAEIGASAPVELPLVHHAFRDPLARATLLRGARLGDVGLAVHADISGVRPRRWPNESAVEWRRRVAWLASSPSAQAWTTRGLRERARWHHDPLFIGRFLDQRWTRAQDAVFVAARRPSVMGIVLAVATRDRWFVHAAVRDALAQNPFTPRALAEILIRTA